MRNTLSKTCLLFLIYSISSVLYAQSKLSVPEEFNVISINGSSVSSSLLQSNNNIKLRHGFNKIALEYEAVFDSENEDHFDIIKSDIFIVDFYVNKNDQYRARYLKQSNAKAARQFAKNPSISITDSQEKNIRLKQFFTASKSMSDIYQQTQINKDNQKTINIQSVPNKKNQTNPNIEQQPNAENMLEYWWQQADEKQRQSFLKKVNH